MIFGDGEIKAAVESGDIGIDPLPEQEAYQPASLDVRLGNEFYDPVRDDVQIRDKVELPPGVRCLAHTQEEISLPNNVAAQITGRSSIGRKGIIVHKTAGWIDPGFSGQITLELANLGKEYHELEAGQRVAQMVFFPLMSTSEGYDGQYQNQTGATESKL